MEVKDYYSILKIPSNASASMIKAAYRKMALATHPDKQPNNPNAIAEFQLIQEAYTILSTPSLKEAYLSQRWYFKSQNKAFHSPLHTPDAILVHLIQLSEDYRYKNVYHIDYDLLDSQLQKLIENSAFPNMNTEAMQHFVSPFIKTFIPLLELLPYKKAVTFILILKDKIPSFASEQLLLQELLTEKKREYWWNRWKFPLVLIFVVFFIVWMLFMR